MEDIYRVCLRSIRMDVTYRLEDGSYIYIYLISMFYNAVGIDYDYDSLTDVYYFIPYTQNTLRNMCDFDSQFTLACRLRFLVDLYGRLENIATGSCC